VLTAPRQPPPLASPTCSARAGRSPPRRHVPVSPQVPCGAPRVGVSPLPPQALSTPPVEVLVPIRGELPSEKRQRKERGPNWGLGKSWPSSLTRCQARGVLGVPTSHGCLGALRPQNYTLAVCIHCCHAGRALPNCTRRWCVQKKMEFISARLQTNCGLPQAYLHQRSRLLHNVSSGEARTETTEGLQSASLGSHSRIVREKAPDEPPLA
jgi:hypothetical protein